VPESAANRQPFLGRLFVRYREGREPMPQPGDFVIMRNGVGRPRFICRTTEVTIKPLFQVDEAFAWDEGEGDRARDWWLDANRRYFARQRRVKGSSYTTRSSPCSNASRWSGRSMSQTGSTGRLQRRPEEG
jgi:hypothetical protein